MAVTVSNIGAGIGLRDIMPSLPSNPDALSLAKAVVDILVGIRQHDLDVRVYLDHDLVEEIGPILASLGVKLRPATNMRKPYIYISQDGDNIAVEVVDEAGGRWRYTAQKSMFVLSLKEIVISRKKKASLRRKVEAVLESSKPQQP